MSDRLLVSTRKGLFTLNRDAAGWKVSGVDFLGDNVSLALSDRRDSALYAALDHGHFGVKLHRKGGGGWAEIATPAYPPKAGGLLRKGHVGPRAGVEHRARLGA
jgi:hypothetical protein